MPVTIENVFSTVEAYLASKVNHPFFLVVGDEKYVEIKDMLFESFGKFIRLSDCYDNNYNDKRPNVDSLLSQIKRATENTAVVGFGEYLALCGQTTAKKYLSNLRDMVLPLSKSVFLFRGVYRIVKSFCDEDPRFDNRRVYFVGNGYTDIKVTFVSATLNVEAVKGFKPLLERLENGSGNRFTVKTNLIFDAPLINTRTINNAYDGVKHIIPSFSLPRESGSDDNWSKLLGELTDTNGNIDSVFDKYGLNNNPEFYFDFYVRGTDFKSWLHFVALKTKTNTLSNEYLKYVMQNTTAFGDFTHNVLNMITGIPITDNRFDKFYRDRNILIEKFTDPEVANYVIATRKKLKESLHYLTDGTLVEKEEIISYFSKFNDKFAYERLLTVYPTLSQYLCHYDFNSDSVPPDLRTQFASYFEEYKSQKLLNKIYPEFESKVISLAQPDVRVYNRLSSRNEIIDKIIKDNTFLYWLDALGVEFLGFIQTKCSQMGLSLIIHIARAELPTITTLNRDFYDSWRGQKHHDERLDALKHKDSGGYDYRNTKLPIHLAKELDIISEVLDSARTKLAMHHIEKFVLASDHGASCLAVIKECELKYETDTKGKHSGRCCAFFETDDLPTAAVDNGFLVLADYGRFRGSRAANVEVHGGASLEEVLVPIVELSLKDSGVQVELVEKKVTASYKKKPEIILFSKSKLNIVSVVVKKKRYQAVKTSDNLYSVLLADLRAGNYSADVFDSDNLIGQVEFTIASESGTKNDSFDDLF
jgi:hypothetical protein